MGKADVTRVNDRLAALSAKTAARAADDLPALTRKSKNARSRDRQSTFRIGVVETDTRVTYPCVVKDLSDTGARITLEGECALSDRVLFRIDQAGIRKKAAVIWQNGVEAGFKFD